MRFDELKTPVYVIDEQKLSKNCSILKDIQDKSGAKILLAQKAFSAYSTYPLIAKYLTGTTASGLFEAKLAFEEFHEKGKTGDKEVHVFEPAFHDDEMEEVCGIADHLVFNSINQLEHHRKIWERSWKEGKLSVGLRVNPEFSTQEGHEIYDPCAPGSRLGIRLCDMPDNLPEGVEGLHFHTLCEQGFEPLRDTFYEFERKFGKYLPQKANSGASDKGATCTSALKWINMGGGHHITRDDYDREGLIELVKYIRETYDIEVYLEPGEAIALDAGYLITTVMDIVKTEKYPVLILDTSAACHMPDVLEMPYRPPLRDSGEPEEKKYTYRLSSRTCLAGDVIGDYSFDAQLNIGDRLVFEDMAIYSMVKNNTFNGMPLPDIALMHDEGNCELVKSFGYEDFKMRL
ncbi:carboxynorspermidine decarboxylase [Butyrivibrio sp. MB2005]|uniref:carboxynorspermidine decarboxylase n=1 Tax=Butyrivibrio sp. MB2005 TaxID=1280678 RepID=UPI0004119AEC|nr:carboxynorspermidine decarboxylase [Butyrivibrio sp. MB2005]